jgi:uncharacterized protein (DUF433 family)
MGQHQAARKKNKHRAKAMIPEIMEKYAYLEFEEITAACAVADKAVGVRWL